MLLFRRLNFEARFCLLTVRGTVRSTVRGTVRGTVWGTVRGTVRGTVWGTVRCGTVQVRRKYERFTVDSV